jgi:hypothetical protein
MVVSFFPKVRWLAQKDEVMWSLTELRFSEGGVITLNRVRVPFQERGHPRAGY